MFCAIPSELTDCGQILNNLNERKSAFDAEFTRIQTMLTKAHKRILETDQELREREKKFHAQETAFEEQLAIFTQEKLNFERAKEKVEDMELKTRDKVTINAGGKIFETSCSTLRKYPESALAAMFSGRHRLAKGLK